MNRVELRINFKRKSSVLKHLATSFKNANIQQDEGLKASLENVFRKLMRVVLHCKTLIQYQLLLPWLCPDNYI